MRHPNGTLQLLDQAQRHFNISVATINASHSSKHGVPDPECVAQLLARQYCITPQHSTALMADVKPACLIIA